VTRAIAVLRPEPGNTRTAARVEALGLAAIRLPLFAVAPLPWQAPDPAGYNAILATSANAFRHGGGELAALRDLPVRAVGAATAAAARAAGFTVETVGDADAASVAAADGRLLHLAGRDHRAVAGMDRVIVYAADPLPVAGAALAAVAGTVALLHSARAARRLGELIAPDTRATVTIVALSAAVADAAAGGWARVVAAPMPRDETLVALAARLAAARDD
jgi:uroporphyrinogen-III synthase